MPSLKGFSLLVIRNALKSPGRAVPPHLLAGSPGVGQMGVSNEVSKGVSNEVSNGVSNGVSNVYSFTEN